MNDDDRKQFEHYVETWVRALQVFARRPKSTVLEWARRFEYDITPGLFFHELPMYYVAEVIVPPRLESSLHVFDLIKLREQILDVIENGDPFCDEDPDFDWEAAKDRVERLLNEYGDSLSNLRLNEGESKPED